MDIDRTIEELAHAIEAGDLSPRALLEQYLDNITARDSVIQAWQWLEADQARNAVDYLPAGPLHGIPIGIKDIFDTADMPTRYGSPIYADHRPRTDAACVAALKNAGALILGKTVTTEFAATHPSKTRNPHDPQRSPGGSSSGSAAAVAAGMIPAALGTQTAGSIIRPASYCGVVGYKPTFGLINRAGLKPFSEHTDTIGVLTRTVADAARVVAGITGRTALTTSKVPDNIRIAVCRPPAWDDAEAASREALQQAADKLAAAGAIVEAVELPTACNAAWKMGQRILSFEATHAFAPELRTAAAQISPTLQAIINRGREVTDHAYDDALRYAENLRIQCNHALFENHDVVLTLSAPGEAPSGLSSTGSPVFNHIWTLLYLPCVNLPGLSGPTGMPVGVQLVGAQHDDSTLLAVAGWAQRAIDSANRRRPGR